MRATGYNQSIEELFVALLVDLRMLVIDEEDLARSRWSRVLLGFGAQWFQLARAANCRALWISIPRSFRKCAGIPSVAV